MRQRKKKKSKAEMLEGLYVGMGATKYVGSDSYPFYIASINNDIIGLYRPETRFAVSWTDGSMTVDPFMPDKPADFYLKPYRGKWLMCDAEGIEMYPREYFNVHFGTACAYRDPSF